MSNKDESPACIDIREDDLLALSAEVLDTLLRDHTTGKNIFWATHDYEALGSEYDYHSEILPELITDEHGMVICPRVQKSKTGQTDRAKDTAEVFTPSLVCNAQNNLVDGAWFVCFSTWYQTHQFSVEPSCLAISEKPVRLIKTPSISATRVRRSGR